MEKRRHAITLSKLDFERPGLPQEIFLDFKVNQAIKEITFQYNPKKHSKGFLIENYKGTLEDYVTASLGIHLQAYIQKELTICTRHLFDFRNLKKKGNVKLKFKNTLLDTEGYFILSSDTFLCPKAGKFDYKPIYDWTYDSLEYIVEHWYQNLNKVVSMFDYGTYLASAILTPDYDLCNTGKEFYSHKLDSILQGYGQNIEPVTILITELEDNQSASLLINTLQNNVNVLYIGDHKETQLFFNKTIVKTSNSPLKGYNIFSEKDFLENPYNLCYPTIFFLKKEEDLLRNEKIIIEELKKRKHTIHYLEVSYG